MEERAPADQTAATVMEILPVALLDAERQAVERLRRLGRSLRIGLGWHYLLDLAWILRHLQPIPGNAVLDAGAGWGLMQWYLCEAGLRVVSVDRESRADLAVRLRCRYRARGLRDSDLSPLAQALRREMTSDSALRSLARQTRNAAELIRRLGSHPSGEVVVYNQDLGELKDIPSESIDAVVAVSSLEHNPPEHLPVVVQELRRVLRPGGKLIATLGASRDQDWFHEPSQGWCYSEETLRQIFGVAPSISSNYDRYDQLLSELRECRELRDNLARFYFEGGDNGMPWGVWDPQYQSVGVMVTV